MLSFHFGNFPTRKTFLITLMTLNTPSPDLPTTPPHHQLYTLCHYHSPILLNHTSLQDERNGWVIIYKVANFPDDLLHICCCPIIELDFSTKQRVPLSKSGAFVIAVFVCGTVCCCVTVPCCDLGLASFVYVYLTSQAEGLTQTNMWSRVACHFLGKSS